MSDIKLADVTIHIDRDISDEIRGQVEASLRNLRDVVSVYMPEDKRHLIVVEYNPDKINSGTVLAAVRELSGHAELIGL
jgi:hypothetical protein